MCHFTSLKFAPWAYGENFSVRPFFIKYLYIYTIAIIFAEIITNLLEEL